MNTTPPQVKVRWHGFNQDYNIYGVALQNTVGDWLRSLPVGTEFSVQEATDLIQQAVDQDIAAKQDDRYDNDLGYEFNEDGGTAAVYRMIEAYHTNKHHYNHWMEVIDREEEKRQRYRRVESISEAEYCRINGIA